MARPSVTRVVGFTFVFFLMPWFIIDPVAESIGFDWVELVTYILFAITPGMLAGTTVALYRTVCPPRPVVPQRF